MKRKKFLQSLVTSAVGTMLVRQGLSMPDPSLTNVPLKMPPYLKAGDNIGITCPASPIPTDELQLCKESINRWGFNVIYGHTVGKQWQRFGGTDEERAMDFQQMLDDEYINAILFGRGGYGVMRIMDRINWDKYVKKPKWLVGFSDITAIHCHMQSLYNIPTIHAGMGGSFKEVDDETVISLKNALINTKQEYKIPGYRLNRSGKTSGKLVGGNLSLITAMQGSKSALQTGGKILFIEDVSEYKYTIDRMMINLKRSGMLDNLAGLIFGAFTGMKTDTEEEFSLSIEEILYDKIKEYEYPVCFRFPAGHQKRNLAFKLGCRYELTVSKEYSLLNEVPIVVPKMNEMSIKDSMNHPVIDSNNILTDSSRIM